MSEMIERLARVLCAHQGENWEAEDCTQTLNGQDADDMREGYQEAVRAVLVELKKPSTVRYDAVSNHDHMWGEMDSETLWRVMIEGMLK